MHLRVRRMCIRRCAWRRKTLYKKNQKEEKTLTCQPSVCILMKRKVRDMAIVTRPPLSEAPLYLVPGVTPLVTQLSRPLISDGLL